MKISQRPRATAIIFIGVGVLAVIVGILVHRFTRRPEVFARIAQADRVVVYQFDKPEHGITYTGVELYQIIEAIQNSRRDRRLYDTPVGVIQLEFYQKNIKLVQIGTCGDLFRFEDKQYRTRNDVLRKLIDLRLYELPNPPAHTQQGR